jgi:hypothetical protein
VKEGFNTAHGATSGSPLNEKHNLLTTAWHCVININKGRD